MHKLKRGKLRSGRGGKVKSRKQAIAIGLSEARHSGCQRAAEESRLVAPQWSMAVRISGRLFF